MDTSEQLVAQRVVVGPNGPKVKSEPVLGMVVSAWIQDDNRIQTYSTKNRLVFGLGSSFGEPHLFQLPDGRHYLPGVIARWLESRC